MIAIGFGDKIRLTSDTVSGNWQVLAIVTDTIGEDSIDYGLAGNANTGITIDRPNTVSSRVIKSVIFSGTPNDTFKVVCLKYLGKVLDEDTYSEFVIGNATIKSGHQSVLWPNSDIDIDLGSYYTIADIDDLLDVERGRIDLLETDRHTHGNKANLDSVDQNLATTDDVNFRRITSTVSGKTRLDIRETSNTELAQDELWFTSNTIDTNLTVSLRSKNGGIVILRLDGSGGEFIGGNYCTISANEDDVLSLYGKGGILFSQQVTLVNMTSTQRDALTPLNGMQIYNTTTNKFQGYANGSWVDLH